MPKVKILFVSVIAILAFAASQAVGARYAVYSSGVDSCLNLTRGSVVSPGCLLINRQLSSEWMRVEPVRRAGRYRSSCKDGKFTKNPEGTRLVKLVVKCTRSWVNTGRVFDRATATFLASNSGRGYLVS